MSRGVAVALVVSLFAAPRLAESKGINPCASFATTSGGVLMVCPNGDGPTLADIGAVVDVTVMIGSGENIEPYPSCCMFPEYIWIAPVGDHGYGLLCNGSFSCNADGMLDENGRTTISGSIAAGGYSEDPVYVVAIGQVVGLDDGCDNPVPLVLASPDIDGDFAVTLSDFKMFAEVLRSGSFDPRMDYNGDGNVDVGDFSMFAKHYLHRCEN